MKRLSITLILLGAAVGAARACTCAPYTLASSFAGSSDVFVGTVLSVHSEGGSIKGRIRIERSWKGTPAGRVVTVHTSRSGASCGVGLPVHHEVILYAHRMTDGKWKGELAAGGCSYSGIYLGQNITMSDSLGVPVTVRNPRKWWPWK
jgi:hypothetical protein